MAHHAAIPAPLILDNLNTAVLVLDARLRIRYLNPAAEDLLKTSLRFGYGQKIQVVAELPPRLRERLGEVIASQAPLTDRNQVLRIAHWGDVVVDAALSPLAIAPEEMGVLMELSLKDRHLRITQEELLLNQHAVTQEVVRGLAHEIKNPLGGLRGAAQLLEKHLEEPALKEYTGIIIKEADRLSRLLSRLQGAPHQPRFALTNIHYILEHVRRLIQVEISTGIDLRFDYDPSLPELQADPEQLIQVFINLVRNAIQAVGQEGLITLRTRVERHFTIGTQNHRLALCAEVQDNGPGIPPELQSKIFLPLVTGRADGMGLGLSIVQSLVAGHGGLVELRSEPGNTRFSVYLPIHQELPKGAAADETRLGH